MVKLGSIATVGIVFGSGCSLNQIALYLLESIGGTQGLVQLVLDSILNPTTGA
jgi:hypothetical protein